MTHYATQNKGGTVERFTAGFSTAANIVMGGMAWVVAYTGMPVEPAVILAVLIGIDFIAGIMCSIALHKPITSHRMKIGLMSKFGVMTIPLIMALTAKGLGADFAWLVNWSVSLFILSESYSIIANIYTARTGVAVPEWDAVSILLNKIKSVLEVYDKRGGE